MNDLQHDLKKLVRHNRDGSFSTQAGRARMVHQIGKQLYELGYKGLRAKNIKPAHIEKLLDSWRGTGLSPGTIKNRLATIRWVAEKIGKPGLVPSDNSKLGIEKRVFVDPKKAAGKADQAHSEGDRAAITDIRVKSSLTLQGEPSQGGFGLRREESIKFQPHWADSGDRIVLKESWTKGGKAREIPITHPNQRIFLNKLKGIVRPGHSLIPPQKSYKEQLKKYENQCNKAGLKAQHGNRYRYAQERYLHLTGWQCPAKGGPTRRGMTVELKKIDQGARQTLTRELGHERLQVVSIYLGG